MILLHVTTPASWPRPFCAGCVVEGGMIRQPCAPVLFKSALAVGLEVARFVEYWQAKGATVETTIGRGQ